MKVEEVQALRDKMEKANNIMAGINNITGVCNSINTSEMTINEIELENKADYHPINANRLQITQELLQTYMMPHIEAGLKDIRDALYKQLEEL